MTRSLLVLLGALVLGTIAGELVLEDPGYLLLTWQSWIVETSLWVGVVGMLALLVLVLLLTGLVSDVLNAADRFRQWRQERRARQARLLTETGLAQYAEAEWRKATSTLLKAAELVDTPLLVRLTGARAAEEEGRLDLAEQVLREARASAGDAAPLIDVRLAEMKLRNGDAVSARLVLERLRERFPKHPRALRLLRDAYVQLGAWRALVDILPALKKLMDDADWQALALRGWGGYLDNIAAEPGYASKRARIDAVANAWKNVPADFRDNARIVHTHARLLVQLGAVAEAQSLLEKTLARSWDDDLVTLYGRLDSETPAEQLASAEKWLAMRPTNAALLLALGRASLRNKLWGKARDYFEASAAREATTENCAELVRLYSRLGESAKAEQYLRKQAELAGTTLPVLPLPSART